MEQTQAQPAFMGADELMQLLDLKRDTFYALARKDQLPVRTIRAGRLMRFSRAEVDRLIHGTAPETTATANDATDR